ncbi:MAG: hydroxymethylglutaryl-CoA lyase, partial [Candidatus Eremiobacteraeota bacterium]|nr:hydroxymethylglutaryl-CoA lyase [Candidatus Eremiobacteraeota bacterium]
MLGAMPRRVTVVEVGPRDGLQNERIEVPTGAKAAFIDALSDAGLAVIEATSFVSARSIPQLADADEVMRRIKRRKGVRYPVLVPNERGLERALRAGAFDIAVFTAASEEFNRRNINASIDESIDRFVPVLARAKREGVWVRGYISMCFGSPFDETIAPAKVVEVAQRLAALGIDEISIGDTIGVATPNQVVDLIGSLTKSIDVDRLAMHFHD